MGEGRHKRAGGRVPIEETGGPGQRWKAFPTVAAVPGPQNAAVSTTGAPGGWDSRREGKAGEGTKRRQGGTKREGGIDDREVRFPTGASPTRTAAALLRATTGSHQRDQRGGPRIMGPVAGRIGG